MEEKKKTQGTTRDQNGVYTYKSANYVLFYGRVCFLYAYLLSLTFGKFEMSFYSPRSNLIKTFAKFLTLSLLTTLISNLSKRDLQVATSSTVRRRAPRFESRLKLGWSAEGRPIHCQPRFSCLEIRVSTDKKQIIEQDSCYNPTPALTSRASHNFHPIRSVTTTQTSSLSDHLVMVTSNTVTTYSDHHGHS